MKILYLYAEVMGYTMATIRKLSERGNEVHVVHWDHKKLTPYQAPALPVAPLYESNTMQDGISAAALGWRDYFTDPQLQALITLALDNNRDLRTAVLRVEEARALYGILAPKDTPKPVVDAIFLAAKKAGEKYQLQISDSLSALGAQPALLDPKEYAAYVADQKAMFTNAKQTLKLSE